VTRIDHTNIVERHAGRAHVEDRGDEIDRAEDRGGAGEMQRQDREIDRRPGMPEGRERRVDGPARADPVLARRPFHEHRHHQQRDRGGKQPERDVVHARERHVRRSDHQRHHPVAEPADQGRHDHEEHHDQAVSGDEHVEDMRIREDLHAGLLQFEPHPEREDASDHAAHHGEHEVHRADVLVVGGEHEASPPLRNLVLVSGRGAFRHRHIHLTLLVIPGRGAASIGPRTRCRQQARSMLAHRMLADRVEAWKGGKPAEARDREDRFFDLDQRSTQSRADGASRGQALSINATQVSA
jgi:hypothetical protein